MELELGSGLELSGAGLGFGAKQKLPSYNWKRELHSYPCREKISELGDCSWLSFNHLSTKQEQTKAGEVLVSLVLSRAFELLINLTLSSICLGLRLEGSRIYTCWI